jgi:caa(3)-type oxidase subunit IV
MADEQKPAEDKPTPVNPTSAPAGDNPTPIDPANPPEPIKEMQAKTIREIRAETVPPQQMPAGAKEAREAEAPQQVEARRETEDALNKPVEAIEDAVNALDRESTPRTPADVLPHPVANSTTIPLVNITVPYTIYDVVFASLAIFTVFEVFVGTVLGQGWLVVLLLLAIAFIKGFHVVYFYMHLKDDNRIFWATLLIPIFIALVGLIYLIAVPRGGY